MQLRAYDIYSFDPQIVDANKVDKFMDQAKKRKDIQGATKPFLRVGLDATRSGSIINYRMYHAPRVRKAIPGWTSPQPKPVLVHHRQDDGWTQAADPIGRVHGAKFVPLVPENELNTDYMTAKRGGKGSGMTLLDVDIVDDDAIQKVIDKRYLTVSTSQTTPGIACSICGKHPFLHGCEHYPGRNYELEEGSPIWQVLNKSKKDAEKKRPLWECFYIWDGEIRNREVSFVNIPAQEYAGVLSVTIMGEDSDQFQSTPFDVYNGAFDHPGVVGVAFSDSIGMDNLLIDDLIRTKPRGLIVNAPQSDYSDTSMNTVDEDKDEPAERETVDEETTVNDEEVKKQIAELTAAKDKAEGEYKTLQGENETLKKKVEAQDKTVADSESALRTSLAQRLLAMRVVCGDFATDAKEEDVEKAISDLAAREASSLYDGIKDLQPRYNQAVVDMFKKAEDADKVPGVQKGVTDASGTVKDPTIRDPKDEPEDDKPTGLKSILFS